MSSAIARFVPILAVSDMARAIAFYELLGFAVRRYSNGDDYAFLTRDGHELHLVRSETLAEGDQLGRGVYFYLPSGTAAALEAEFLKAGITPRSPLAAREWRMNEFVLIDPDANLLRFGEPTSD